VTLFSRKKKIAVPQVSTCSLLRNDVDGDHDSKNGFYIILSSNNIDKAIHRINGEKSFTAFFEDEDTSRSKFEKKQEDNGKTNSNLEKICIDIIEKCMYNGLQGNCSLCVLHFNPNIEATITEENRSEKENDIEEENIKEQSLNQDLNCSQTQSELISEIIEENNGKVEKLIKDVDDISLDGLYSASTSPSANLASIPAKQTLSDDIIPLITMVSNPLQENKLIKKLDNNIETNQDSREDQFLEKESSSNEEITKSQKKSKRDKIRSIWSLIYLLAVCIMGCVLLKGNLKSIKYVSLFSKSEIPPPRFPEYPSLLPILWTGNEIEGSTHMIKGYHNVDYQLQVSCDYSRLALLPSEHSFHISVKKIAYLNATKIKKEQKPKTTKRAVIDKTKEETIWQKRDTLKTISMHPECRIRHEIETKLFLSDDGCLGLSFLQLYDDCNENENKEYSSRMKNSGNVKWIFGCDTSSSQSINTYEKTKLAKEQNQKSHSSLSSQHNKQNINKIIYVLYVNTNNDELLLVGVKSSFDNNNVNNINSEEAIVTWSSNGKSKNNSLSSHLYHRSKRNIGQKLLRFFHSIKNKFIKKRKNQ